MIGDRDVLAMLRRIETVLLDIRDRLPEASVTPQVQPVDLQKTMHQLKELIALSEKMK